jgi:hypothetical protein
MCDSWRASCAKARVDSLRGKKDESIKTQITSGPNASSLTGRMNQTARRRRPGRPRLPWKRGPAAWEVAKRAEEILELLSSNKRRFLSLRRAASILGISTQPLRDWTQRGYIRRNGPRLQYGKDELCRFVKLLEKRATPFGPHGYLERLYGKLIRPPYRFDKLNSRRLHFAFTH